MSETFEAAVGLLRNDPSRATASAKCEKFGEAHLLFRAPGYAFVITVRFFHRTAEETYQM